jgi:hypothetical protein
MQHIMCEMTCCQVKIAFHMHAMQHAAAAAQASLLPHMKLSITAPNEFLQLDSGRMQDDTCNKSCVKLQAAR